jgi:ABC-type amino acid transport substrate-binding protein
VLRPFTGDYNELLEHRLVRVGVTFNRTFYFVDRGVQRGVAYEYGRRMEDKINETLRSGHIKVHVFFVPMPRERLLPALIDGRVDAVAAQLTITPERQALVDFSDPTRTNVNEIVVTAPGTPALSSVHDLSSSGAT